MRGAVINGVVRMTDYVSSRFSQACLMCMQVAAINLFLQHSSLLPLLIILAPCCPIDNVSIDEHLLIQNTGGLEVVSVTLKGSQTKPSLSLSIFVNFNFKLNFNIKISLSISLHNLRPSCFSPSTFITLLSLPSGAANVSLLLIRLLVPSYY